MDLFSTSIYRKKNTKNCICRHNINVWVKELPNILFLFPKIQSVSGVTNVTHKKCYILIGGFDFVNVNGFRPPSLFQLIKRTYIFQQPIVLNFDIHSFLLRSKQLHLIKHLKRWLEKQWLPTAMHKQWSTSLIKQTYDLWIHRPQMDDQTF